MDISGRFIFDDWMKNGENETDLVPLERSPKTPNIPALYDEKPTPKGLDLFQHIIWGLDHMGVYLDDERKEKIKRACLE